MLSAAARPITSCGIVKVGGCDLIDDLGGRVAEHALGADVEDLDDALGVGGNAREIGAVEDCALQGAGCQQSFGAPSVWIDAA